MAIALPDLTARIRVDSSALDGVQEKASRVGSSFKRLAGVAAGAFAGLAVGSTLKDAVSQASDLSESVSKNEVVFGAASEKVLEFGRNAATAFGQSQTQALEATGVFGNLLRSVGLAEDVAADMSVEFAGLASDMASFNNTSVDDALGALRSGLVGETEPLKRFGVNLNQARIEAEALALGLVAPTKNAAKIAAAQLKVDKATKKAAEAIKEFGVESAEANEAQVALGTAQDALNKATEGSTPKIDAAAKAQAAYSLILKDTELAQGDFARTSDGLANQQRILGATWDNLKTRIGTVLLPAVQRVVSFLNDNMLPAFDKVVEFGGKVGDTLRDAFSGNLDAGGVLGVIGTVAESLKNLVTEGIPAVGRAFVDGLNGEEVRGGGLLGVVAEIGDAIGGLGRMVPEIDFSRIASTASTARDSLVDKFRDLGGKIGDAIGPVDLSAVVQDAAKDARRTGERVIKGITTAVEKGDFGPLGKAVGGGIAKAVDSAAKRVTEITAAIGRLMKKVDWIGLGIEVGKLAVPLAVGFVTGLLNFDLLALLRGVADHWFEIFIAALTLGLAPTKLIGVIANLLRRIPLGGRLVAWALEAFAGFGRFLVRGIGDVLSTFAKAFLKAIGVESPKIIGGFTGIFSAIARTIRSWAETLALLALEAIERLARTIANYGPRQVVNAFRTVRDAITRFFGGAASWLLAAGRRIVDGLLAGLRAAFGSVLSWVRGIGGRIIGGIGSAGSWLYGAGRDVVAGLLRGIRSKAGDIVSTIKRYITDKIPDFVKKAWDIFSPSRVFMELGRQAAAGMEVGILGGADRVARAANALTTLPTVSAPRVPAAAGIGAAGTVVNHQRGSSPVFNLNVTMGGEQVASEIRHELNRLVMSGL